MNEDEFGAKGSARVGGDGAEHIPGKSPLFLSKSPSAPRGRDFSLELRKAA